MTDQFIPVIPIDLVGQQAALHEKRYSDAYLDRINQTYPLDEVLGDYKARIAGDSGTVLHFLTMGSPLRKKEGERVLRFILKASARAGLWQPDITDTTGLSELHYAAIDQCLADIGKDPVKTHALDEGFLYGVQVARKGGFVLPTSHLDQLVLLPSQAMVEYFAGKK